ISLKAMAQKRLSNRQLVMSTVTAISPDNTTTAIYDMVATGFGGRPIVFFLRHDDYDGSGPARQQYSVLVLPDRDGFALS
ncbi:MAG: hypothetical protein PVF37_09695, partial [Desulfobacterales bacterium]